MTIIKNLGGDRLGSGNKMNVAMHNYERSTHDLSKVWRSSMSCGTLVPFLTEITLPGDTFDINLNTMIRTLPTLAPLFGSFKVQLDVFSVPIRLYNAQLHMNKLGVGLDMKKVKLPMMKIACNGRTQPDKFNQSCLLAYLGVRGAPLVTTNGSPNTDTSFTKNALPLLAYWDIYKNYYSNKQEEKGYLISNSNFNTYEITYFSYYTGSAWTNVPFTPDGSLAEFNNPLNVSTTKYKINFQGKIDYTYLSLKGEENGISGIYLYNLYEYFTIVQTSDSAIELTPKFDTIDFTFYGITPYKTTTSANQLIVKAFPLTNIDDTILSLLKFDTNIPFEINEMSKSPYVNCVGTVYPYVQLTNYYSQNGLGIKTYQSDIFNNWLNTEWIDGTNGINTITAISTSEGSFTIDTLNLSKKVYDMLNRVAVSGGSYEDWQTAIWGEEQFRKPESPIYCGGLSTELIFEEVISTADSTIPGETQNIEVPLGSLAGRGTQSQKRKGGNIVIKTTEPSIIMGIVSITPRIDYSQGNRWYTRLQTMDDFHKPALDGIGFQELITEQMAHWDATYETTTKAWTYKSAGKQPAWIDYMTNYNETFGHFAEDTGNDALMQLTLNRQYEFLDGSIKDLTTYIDPVKYNYAFASTDLSAQNFWVQIACDIEARRKMSAKIIPNL